MISVSLVLFVLSACGTTGNNTPTQPPTPSTTSSTPAPGVSGDRAAGLAYLQSPDRVAAYEKIMPAGVKIAKAILRGEFGAFRSLDSKKKDAVDPAYTGWGGLHVTEQKAYAYVWWQDGAVDLSKGVAAFSLDGVMVVKEESDEFYRVFHRQTEQTRVLEPEYFGGKSPQGIHRYPTSVEEAKKFDTEALAALEASLRKAGL